MKSYNYNGLEVAVIGMSCKFPKASNYNEYWNNLLERKESIETLSDDELCCNGITNDLIHNSNYVKKYMDFSFKENFDFKFFEYTYDEALLLAPQYRILHECLWEALEDANYVYKDVNLTTSLFLAMEDDLNWKIYTNLIRDQFDVDDFTYKILTSYYHIPSLIANKLNFNGKCLAINTACSSSLVSIDLAFKSLLLGECNIAIAGGVYILSSIKSGYLYNGKSIESSDGRCKPFDAKADGTSWGEGVGLVVLKRLQDAIADGDYIHGIIKGSFVNNNGNRKATLTSPSIKGQVECISNAYKMFSVLPETISYIEAHATGTYLGDPIEIEALKNLKYLQGTPIGSVKANIGHLNIAAGIASLIKSILIVKNRIIPPQINFDTENPQIDLDKSPFFVNTNVLDLQKQSFPIRVGINSFGLSGVNAHLIIEEYKVQEKERLFDTDQLNILPLSAKSLISLNKQYKKIVDYIPLIDEVQVQNLAYTLRCFRNNFIYRKPIIIDKKKNILSCVEHTKSNHYKIVFLFAGQGTEYSDMGRLLYNHLDVFKKTMNDGFNTISDYSKQDFKKLFFESKFLNLEIESSHVLITLFQYALTSQLIALGIRPNGVLGHSLGEYAASAISGIAKFDDILKIVYDRALLIKTTKKGAMLSIVNNIIEINKFCKEYDCDIASYNSNGNYSISGLKENVNKVKRYLKDNKIPFVDLNSQYAFHSNSLYSIKSEFCNYLNRYNFCEPSIIQYSCLTGHSIKSMDCGYWAKQMVNPVSISSVFDNNNFNDTIFVNIGPGTSLLKSVQNLNGRTIPSNKNCDEYRSFIETIASLWGNGFDIDWNRIYSKKSKVALSTYDFDRYEFKSEVNAFKEISQVNQKQDYYTYVKKWAPVKLEYVGNQQKKILLFRNDDQIGDGVVESLFNNIVGVRKGDNYVKIDEYNYLINPNNEQNYYELFHSLKRDNKRFEIILDLWTFGQVHVHTKQAVQSYFCSFSYLYRQLYNVYGITQNFIVNILSNKLFKLSEFEKIEPLKSLMSGVCKVSNVEFENVHTKLIDIDDFNDLSISKLNKIIGTDSEGDYVIRNEKVYRQNLSVMNLDSRLYEFKKHGVYLITGGYGGLGYQISCFLANSYGANLIIIGRKADDKKKRSYLESLGAKVYYIKTDLIDKDFLHKEIKLINNTLERDVNGVFHTAGVGDYSGLMIRRKILEKDDTLIPKVYGTLILDSIFKETNLDFFINFSSKATTIIYPGQLSYVSANLFLESFTLASTDRKYVIEWPAIKDVGMAHYSYNNKENEINLNIEEFEKKSLAPHYVIEIIRKTISNHENLIVVSKNIITNNLKHRKKDFTRIDSSCHTDIKQRNSLCLTSDYVPPIDSIDIEIINLIRDILRIDIVSLKDSFYELGGNSLSAMIITNKIKKKFNVDLSLNDFLDSKTIDRISNIVKAKSKKQIIIE